jgi:hypothetical protein
MLEWQVLTFILSTHFFCHSEYGIYSEEGYPTLFHNIERTIRCTRKNCESNHFYFYEQQFNHKSFNQFFSKIAVDLS